MTSLFNKYKGFNLLEAMVTVAILAGMATIGVTIYGEYINKAKITEALIILEKYQLEATKLHAKYDAIDPFYVLFPDGKTTSGSGYVSGSSNNTSIQSVDLKYVASVQAQTVVSGADTYTIIGAILRTDSTFTSSTNTVYIAGKRNGTTSELTWSCGQYSAGNSVVIEYLPQNCRSVFP